MCKETGCNECDYSESLKECASHHVGGALKLLSEGKIKEAEENLRSLEQHLIE
ncbi:MAG: hypothetical protein ACLFVP_07220 [Candidatus Bathyarchaeia archaeon]